MRLQVLIIVRGRPRGGAGASGKAIDWNTPPRNDVTMAGRPSRHARNGAEARTCRAMPRHSIVEMLESNRKGRALHSP